MDNGGYNSNSKIFPAELLLLMAKYTLPSFYGKIYTASLFEVLYIHDHLANLWNRITTKILDMFRIIALKQHTFSQSDPVLIRQFSKKLQSYPVLILPKLASVLIKSCPYSPLAEAISGCYDALGWILNNVDQGTAACWLVECVKTVRVCWWM